MGAWLRHKLAPAGPAVIEDMLARRAFVYADGSPLHHADPYTPHTFVWFHRDLRAEPVVPFEVAVLYRDERIVVVDKPPFLSTIPRGRHVLQSVVVRLRDALDLPELAPAHRLDRLTSGVLMLTTQQRWRAPYQQLFEHRLVRKTYRALAPVRPDLEFPREVRNHLVKRRGSLQAESVPGLPPNARTTIELVEVRDGTGCYRLTPHTGKTHQLRIHLHELGIPILGDPLYPVVRDVSIDDFSEPLQLLADTLTFHDPVDGQLRRFASERALDWPAAAGRQ
ncbi:pseudouridine synthase [Granulicoccus phenolivorans]|uniref:pseudouridine synthase n=1 Tax=Granulicoccus phenolivorans TaxID=266854 RepID=UPI0035710E84